MYATLDHAAAFVKKLGGRYLSSGKAGTLVSLQKYSSMQPGSTISS